MSRNPSNTPWGAPQHRREICDGITWFSTASHGGYYVTPERRADMPAAFRGFVPWAGAGWFEEDCDWAIVVASFPGRFTADLAGYAYEQLKSNRSYYEGRGVVYPDRNI